MRGLRARSTPVLVPVVVAPINSITARRSVNGRPRQFCAPGLGDAAEQPVLDLVPLRRTRRRVIEVEREPALVGEYPEFARPKPDTHPVRSATVGRDSQFACLGIGRHAVVHARSCNFDPRLKLLHGSVVEQGAVLVPQCTAIVIGEKTRSEMKPAALSSS